jgi:hypothetical protein
MGTFISLLLEKTKSSNELLETVVLLIETEETNCHMNWFLHNFIVIIMIRLQITTLMHKCLFWRILMSMKK